MSPVTSLFFCLCLNYCCAYVLVPRNRRLQLVPRLNFLPHFSTVHCCNNICKSNFCLYTVRFFCSTLSYSLAAILLHFFILGDKSFGHSLLLNYVFLLSCSLLHTFYPFLRWAFWSFSFFSPYFFLPVPDMTFFVSFPINLKEEIYFCRNFLQKAFESPSLVVTPRALPLPASSPTAHSLITLLTPCTFSVMPRHI